MARMNLAPLALGALLVGAGIAHGVRPEPFDAIVPGVFPDAARRPLTYASGVVELVTGALLLVPRSRRLGGWLAFVLLLAVWPANIDHAVRSGSLLAWLRVPLQLPLLWVAWRAAHAEDAAPTRSAP